MLTTDFFKAILVAFPGGQGSIGGLAEHSFTPPALASMLYPEPWPSQKLTAPGVQGRHSARSSKPRKQWIRVSAQVKASAPDGANHLALPDSPAYRHLESAWPIAR